MFDGTEVLFGAGRDLDHVSQQPIGVGTVNASHLFDQVQIPEAASIKYQVISARDLGYAIDRKANGLVEGNCQIQKQEGNRAQVNDRRRQNDQRVNVSQVGPQRFLEEVMLRWV